MPDGDWIHLTHVELKEHMDSLCSSRMDRLYDRICHERELREAEAVSRAKALEGQAVEYSRRLHDLNGEAAALKAAHAESRDELKKMQERYLLESRFVQYLADRSKCEDQRNIWEESVSKQLNRYGGALAAWAVVLVVVSILIKFLPIGP